NVANHHAESWFCTAFGGTDRRRKSGVQNLQGNFSDGNCYSGRTTPAIYRSGTVAQPADSLHNAGERCELCHHRSLEKRGENFVLSEKFISFQRNDGKLCKLLIM